MENKKINFNLTLLLPYGFIPRNITKPISMEPLSEDVVEFTFIPQISGSSTGFIRIEYDGNKIIKDFNIEVYAPERFIDYFVKNYWWVIVIGLIILIIMFVYKNKDKIKRKEKSIYVFKRKDLLP
jgi:uncharacterized integral membrane protein